MLNLESRECCTESFWWCFVVGVLDAADE